MSALSVSPFTDISDVKVFVDLAFISAGENDTDIDRVACFHAAVMGFSPLLYSLSFTADFREFMTCAGQVWDTLRRDEKLPDKLVNYSSLTYNCICRHDFLGDVDM